MRWGAVTEKVMWGMGLMELECYNAPAITGCASESQIEIVARALVAIADGDVEVESGNQKLALAVRSFSSTSDIMLDRLYRIFSTHLNTKKENMGVRRERDNTKTSRSHTRTRGLKHFLDNYEFKEWERCGISVKVGYVCHDCAAMFVFGGGVGWFGWLR
ncbi:hypothetical protein Tco_0655658 [Tanacetum coccineum]|uniref:Uncharacterized protein n=1 Tax=Tanacetum coccineum TaxID=301880 RepID=A0ABQ4X6L6_9ASTR